MMIGRRVLSAGASMRQFDSGILRTGLGMKFEKQWIGAQEMSWIGAGIFSFSRRSKGILVRAGARLETYTNVFAVCFLMSSILKSDLG